MGNTLLLTGRPKVGKTTITKRVAAALGDRAGGFYTEEIRDAGERKGFRLITLEGQSAVMAHVDLRARGGPQVSRYGVDLGVVERVGVAAIRQAMQKGQILIVDEIGKMELYCSSFKEAVLQAAVGPFTLVATVMARPHSWVDALKASPGVTTWEVTVDNRNALPQRVMQRLKRATQTGEPVLEG